MPMTRTVLIPLDLASPTTDHLAVRKFIEWFIDSILKPSDKVVLVTIVSPPDQSSITRQVSKGILIICLYSVIVVVLSTLGWLNNESVLPSTDAVNKGSTVVKDSLTETTQQKLNQFASMIKSAPVVVSKGNDTKTDIVVETKVEVCNESTFDTLKKLINDERVRPDMVCMYERDKTQEKSPSIFSNSPASISSALLDHFTICPCLNKNASVSCSPVFVVLPAFTVITSSD